MAALEAALPARAVPDGQVRAIGLTGGIGSGKSTVAAMLATLGATVVDTDAIAHGLTAPGGAAMPALVRAFGADVADARGALDRARMRAIVFADATARQRLEAVLDPLIGLQALQRADAAWRADAQGVVVFDVPLLAESGHWRGRCQRVLVVDADEETQVRRVVARSGWPEAQVRSVIAQQATRAQRAAIADAVLPNHTLSLPALQEAVTALWHRWCGPAMGV